MARILKRFEKAVALGIDRDGDALDWAGKALGADAGRVTRVRGDFGALARHCAAIGWIGVDAVLLDLGVSSPQLDTAARGFSHRRDGPLDMRMDGRAGATACGLLNEAPEEELARVFREYGELPGARRLARAVAARRAERPWRRTGEFAALCEACLPRPRRGGPPAAALAFQALRIAVNGELEQLEAALAGAAEVLRPGGRLVVISYHSLEDRRVKDFMRRAAAGCDCPRSLPVCVCGKAATMRILTRKPLSPSPEEVAANPRARSARLRAAEAVG